MLGTVRALLSQGRNVRRDALRHLGLVSPMIKPIVFTRYESSKTERIPNADEDYNLNDIGRVIEEGDSISHTEAKKLKRLADLEALKKKLGGEGKEVIGYSELLKACQSVGVARSPDEAASIAQVLDEEGVVLLFRDQVYLNPNKIIDMVRKSVPLALSDEDDPRREELKKLQEEKEKLDMLAYKQVRFILWTGLGFAIMQVGAFVRLTFWEYSWDVMEPVAFFATCTGVIISYAYFLYTSRDPTYRDFMERLFLSRQRKIFKKYNFDIKRFQELQQRCKFPHRHLPFRK